VIVSELEPAHGAHMSQLPSSTPQQFLPAPTVVALRTRRGPELASLIAVRKEMSKVYRQVRSGKIRSEEGSRLTFILASIGKVIEAADLEQRLIALEQGAK